MCDLGHWVNCSGIELTDNVLENTLGFVYEIRGPNWFYIGRKQFWHKRGRYWYESDWREYQSSSGEVKERCGDVEVEYRILAIFQNKSSLRYGETLAIVRSKAYCCSDSGLNWRVEPCKGKVKFTGTDLQQTQRLEEIFE